MHISYTKQAANAVRYAAKKAKEMKHPYIGTEHLLLGLREEFSGVAGQVLAQNGVETEKIMQLMDELIAPREEMPASQKPKESPRLRYILANSEKEAHRLRTAEVGTEHLLLSMIRDVDCVAARILITLNISLQKLLKDILNDDLNIASSIDNKINKIEEVKQEKVSFKKDEKKEELEEQPKNKNNLVFDGKEYKTIPNETKVPWKILDKLHPDEIVNLEDRKSVV